jgi:hypothetical protein
VAGKCVAHSFRQRSDVGRRAHFCQDVPDKFHFSIELGAIQFEKVSFHGEPDHVSDGEQHCC